MVHFAVRVHGLGMDRRYNRYWYFGPDSEEAVTAQSAINMCRLFVQNEVDGSLR